jgi:UPF0755 protein
MLKRINKSLFVLSVITFVLAVTLLPGDRLARREGGGVTVIVKMGTSLSGIAALLKDRGLIPSSTVFLLASLLYRGQLIAGEYTLGRDMNTFEIARKMARGERNIYVLRIREGDTIYDIADAMEKAKIMASDEFLELATNAKMRERSGLGGVSLEGYLAPDTYYYGREIDVEDFLGRITERTTRLFAGEDIQNRMKEMHLDMQKTVTLASMIEREAQKKEEKPLISAVFHNRLSKGMSLDCDPTVIYGTGKFHQPITKSDLLTYTPYNTYRFPGLPKGPIGNPDKGSIMAALYPAKVDYLYFVSRNDGTHAFSKGMNEHNRYVIMYQRGKKTKNNK